MKIYHHDDLDGRASAAILYRSGLIRRSPACQLIEMDYDKELDLSAIAENEQIYIVDFSFKPEIMEKMLEKTKQIVWIDHHKTSLEYKYSQELDGIRSNDLSGCELTMKYVAPMDDVPRAITLIGDMDRWIWAYGDASKDFCEGLRVYDTSPASDLWEDLLFKESLIPEITEKGKICRAYRDVLCSEYLKKYGFETELDGNKAIAVNLNEFGSLAFGNKVYDYNLCITFAFDGKKWNLGLYSESMDVGELAEKFGGGGHRGSAGCSVKELPFKKTNGLTL